MIKFRPAVIVPVVLADGGIAKKGQSMMNYCPD